MDNIEKPTIEQLPTALPGDIPPVPKLETEPTAERIKTPRYSSKIEIEKLKKEFSDYKKIVERDFTEIDESLEENFTKLYKAVEKTAQRVTKRGELTKIESSLDRLTRSVNKMDNRSFKSVLNAAKRIIPKDLHETLDPKQVAVAKYVASNFDDKRKGETSSSLKPISEKLKGGGELSIKEVGTTKGKRTASKVSGGMDSEYQSMTNILSNIYGLMKKSKEDDTKQKEIEKDFEQSKKEDKEKKHKELIDAIRSIGIKSVTEEYIEKETGGGIADTIKQMLDAFGGLKMLLQIGTALASPLGLALLGITAATGAAAYIGSLVKDWLENKEEESDRKKGGQAAVDAKKRMKEQYNPLDESGIITENNPEMTSATNDYRDAVKQKSTSSATPVSSSSSPSTPQNKSNAAPSSLSTLTPPVPVSPPSAAPAPSPNKGAELNSKVSQNQDMKLAQNAIAEPKIINNTSSSSTSTEGSQRIPIPPVRNTEETFGRLSMYATRTV